MGLSLAVRSIPILATMSFTLLQAQPRLRLSTTVVGPITVATGANAATQSLEASNSGNGSLNLQAASSASWVKATIEPAHLCAILGSSSCIPITLAFTTGSLAAGTYTGIITISDPNAIDAPQTVTITVAVGGTIPNSVDLYVAPNGSRDTLRVSTNNFVNGAVTAQGGSWLSFGFTGLSTFAYALPFSIIGKHLPGMAEGNYAGSIAISGSSLASDNKSVNVNLHVTSQPIMQLSGSSLVVSSAVGAPKRLFRFTYSNRGSGSLLLGNVTASGGSWLTVTFYPQFNIFDVNVDSGALAPGSYTGSISVPSNAANGTQSVPVTLTVFPQGPPVGIRVANNANFAADEEIAQGTIVALFGEQLTTLDPVSATTLPLPTTMGNARVLVNGVAAPVYYTQYDQINFQVPYDAAIGTGTVRVERNQQAGNQVSIRIAARAPKLLRLGIGEYGILVNQDQSFPIPATPGINSRPARAGDVLTMYALGLGQTTPAVTSGAASPTSPLASIAPESSVTFGIGDPNGSSLPVKPQFIGLTPNFVGLYQVNVQVPSDSPKGARVVLELSVGQVASNRVEIAVQ